MNPKPLPTHQSNTAVPNNTPSHRVASAGPGDGPPSAPRASGAPSPHPAHKNPNDKVFSLPESEIEDGSLEAGLLCLSHWVAEHPGLTLSRAEIAHVCGCSESFIATVEQRALRRIKRLHTEMLRDNKGPTESVDGEMGMKVSPE